MLPRTAQIRDPFKHFPKGSCFNTCLPMKRNWLLRATNDTSPRTQHGTISLKGMPFTSQGMSDRYILALCR